MKTRYIIIIFLFASLICNAQIVYLTTPKGSKVYAFKNAEMSASDIQYYTNQTRIQYPQAEVLVNASARYNCHSYAWNLSEGGTEICWLNQDPDLHLYWDDGSYVATNENEAVKIFYYAGDHSAIKSSTHTGKYESKWGKLPLMRHSPTYGPTIYNMSSRWYYKKAAVPSISGPVVVCSNSNSTYTVANLPSGASVSWSVSPGLYIVDNFENYIYVAKDSYSDTSFGEWVKATISYNGNVSSVSKSNIAIWRSGIQNIIIGQAVMQGAAYPTGAEYSLLSPTTHDYFDSQYGTNFVWSVDVPSWSISYGQGYPLMLFAGDVYCGSYYVTVSFMDACGCQSVIYRQYETNCINYILSPNPASTEVSVEIKDGTAGASGVASYVEPAYTVQIVSMSGSLAYHGKKKGKKFDVPVSSLRDGIYNVIITDGKRTGQGKLVVKH